MKYKQSKWFSGTVKPHHVGVYKRSTTSSTETFSKWDGKRWLFSSSTVTSADRQVQESVYQNSEWCGIVKP